ncbi:type 4a pilus biogenesis protein PilO [Herbaspirillum rhizosphaerae]|uniref:Type 4a pilus biogenesis protein PilO n=1 Tax=Herbaspirillum rhizosphaerae TaxID=346179 RepID=A0ABW8ZB77_9BURK
MISFRPERFLPFGHPADWPRAWQALICFGALALVVLLGWHFHLQPDMARLARYEQEEQALKNTYVAKIKITASLPLLHQQQQQAADALRQVQQPLVAQEERNTLLQDIASAARTHGLLLESIRPGQMEIKPDYTSYAIGMRLSGYYHALGSFAADIAAMPYIVTLNDLQLTVNADGTVVMDVVAVSYHRGTTASDSDENSDVSLRRSQ